MHLDSHLEILWAEIFFDGGQLKQMISNVARWTKSHLSWFVNTRKKRIVVSLLLFVLVVQSLNFTGFCFSKIQYLSPLEITYAGMAETKDIDESMKQEPPACCRVTGEPSHWSSLDKFVNKLVGNYRFEVVSYTRNPDTESSDYDHYPFYVRYTTVNACGKDAYPETGTSKTRAVYEGEINRIRKYWAEQLQ